MLNDDDWSTDKGSGDVSDGIKIDQVTRFQ